MNVSEVMHAVASKMKSAVLGKISQAGYVGTCPTV